MGKDKTFAIYKTKWLSNERDCMFFVPTKKITYVQLVNNFLGILEKAAFCASVRDALHKVKFCFMFCSFNMPCTHVRFQYIMLSTAFTV